MRPLRMVHVCADRGVAPGSTKGAAQHLRGIAGGIAAAGHSVTCYSARPAEGDFPVPVRPLASLAGDPIWGTNVIYERYSLGHTEGLALARRIGARFVLEVNAPLVAEARTHRPHTVSATDAATERRLIEAADLVITVSAGLTEWVSSMRRGPTVTIANGFEPAWFADPGPSTDDPRSSNTLPSHPTLAFLGHPKPWHGAERLVPLLIEPVLRLANPRLFVIGGGQGAGSVVALARRHSIADRVTITGALPPDRASAMLSKATIGIAPYPRQDPFYFCPLKVIDYLAAGLPVVSTDQGDVASLVGDAGIVVDPDDDRALAEAVAELLADPVRAAEMGAEGRRRVHETMTWRHVAARTVDAIVALGSIGAAQPPVGSSEHDAAVPAVPA